MGLAALSSGCGSGGGEAPEETGVGARVQDIVITRPASCQAVKNANPSAGDGEYLLYVQGNPAQPWRAYCHGMAGTPAEYLTLRETGASSNFSQYTAGGATLGSSVRTRYSKIRIDPATLRVGTADRTYASSTGQLQHGPVSVTSMPYGVAMSCDWQASGVANIDLSGTPFAVAPNQFWGTGYYPTGGSRYAQGDQVVDLTGGGYCGWLSSGSSEGFDGGQLSLVYKLPDTAAVPAVRVYTDGGYQGQVQSLQPGWYDSGQLTVGNDVISSLKVPSGWSITLYEHGGFSGRSKVVTADTELSGGDFDNLTSSLSVQAPVLLYADGGYQGRVQSLQPGRYDIGQLTVGNDVVSSLRVPAGWRVTLYEHAAFSGRSKVVTADTELSGGDFDNVLSSLVVESPSVHAGNILYGHWRGSGGQSPSSPANRQFLVDYTGPADTVTFELTSSADAYLYLLDSSGNVLAADDNGGGGTHARLAYFLSPGSYKLVAATATSGQSAEFTVRSDKARLRFSQQLWVKAVTQLDWIYDDFDTGAHDDVSVWRANLGQYPGYYSLGDVAMPSHGVPARMTFVVSGEGDLLARPVDYNWIWSDWGSGGEHDVSFWDPVAPAGYTCLGTVTVLGYDKPSTDLIRCLKNEYVLPGNPAWVWNDSGSGADYDVGLWQSNPRDHRGLTLSTFKGQGNYDGPDASRFWVINKSAVANAELQGSPVDELTALQYAPRVWLEGGEYYFPSSVEFFLPNVHEDNGNLVTNESLGCDSCTDPQFLDGQRPDQTHVPMYAQIVTRTQNGLPTNITDIIYWTFYPYNNGKRVCIGWYSPWGCVGAYSTFGNHVGDWEHLTVRFVDGRPSQLYMSQHSGGQAFHFGDKEVALLGWHPEAYAAWGSHAIYPDASRHVYQNLPNGDFLADDTSRGIAWNGWDGPVIFSWQPMGTYTGNLSWLNITSDWGNRSSGCGIAEYVSGQCVLNGGPTAPMKKDFARPDVLDLN